MDSPIKSFDASNQDRIEKLIVKKNKNYER